MIVLVESVLELALQQESAVHAEAIVGLARGGTIELAIPAGSLGEPLNVLLRRRQARNEACVVLGRQESDLARSPQSAGLAVELATAADRLEAFDRAEPPKLARTLHHVAAVATLLPLSAAIIEAALLIEKQYRLSLPDAIVFASVEHYLTTFASGPRMFVTKDRKGCDNQQIKGRLRELDCKLVTTFLAARQFLENTVTRITH